jgi:hypothetical protein
MKNYKKIIILTILFLAIIGIALETVSAGKKTVKINDKKWEYEEYLYPAPNSAGWSNEQNTKVGSKKILHGSCKRKK